MPQFEPFLKNLPCIHQGKVRDTFSLPGHPDMRLQAATNRVSTFNYAHLSPIPDKGAALTALVAYWAGVMDEFNLPHHVIAVGHDVERFLPPGEYPSELFSQAIVALNCEVIPRELIWRTRLAGSLWVSCQKGEPNPYGLVIPDGLRLMSPFPEPVFTPTDKSDTDDPVLSAMVMTEYPEAVRLSLDAYTIGAHRLDLCGIELIDGKFEVGVDADGKTRLVDEWLTPDCCRMVRKGSVVVGEDPPWLDKEYVRAASKAAWGDGPKYPLTFSDDVIRQTTERYRDLVLMITGSSLDWWKANL